jgi:hypothetical protein
MPDMDNDTVDGRQRSTSTNGQKDWGARGSLRRNAGLDKGLDDEVTPLLGNGESSSGASGDGSGGRHEWEGAADFEGLTWWHTPSVSLIQS